MKPKDGHPYYELGGRFEPLPKAEAERGGSRPTPLHRRAQGALSLDPLGSAQKEDEMKDTRICRICDGGPGNDGPCLCGSRLWDNEGMPDAG